MKLSEAIAISQDERWQEKQREEEAKRQAASQRERRELVARKAFLSWFYDTTGIDEVEDAELFVQENGTMDVWWRFNATGNQVRFNGDVLKSTDGGYQVFPSKTYSSSGAITEEPNWHAVNGHYNSDYRDFVDAAIYALNLPKEKPRANALLVSGAEQ